ncbi:MAG: multidrug efflux SMR transporter [Deltaproteobacteria bacterium]
MSWFYLSIAGIFEIGWPLGLKLSQTMTSKVVGIAIAIISMTLSGVFLWLAQRTIPMGTAYAVWTGIGAAGTFIVGILLFKDPSNIFRIISVSLVIIGVVGLKLSN